jgi:hypothetical protein
MQKEKSLAEKIIDDLFKSVNTEKLAARAPHELIKKKEEEEMAIKGAIGNEDTTDVFYQFITRSPRPYFFERF